MRASKLLAKLRANQPARICSLGHFIPSYIRQAAHFGFDCVWLDLEHRAMGEREVQTLLAFFHLFDIDCMLRPPTLEKTRLYRYLEDGAAGLMIPHVSTAEKARALVDAVKFPPLGGRGIDGAGLDSDFLLQGGADYPQQANRETFLVVQIETPQAVQNVAEIAAVDGVEGLFVGTADLQLRLKQIQGGPTLQQALQQVAEAAQAQGKFWGCPAGSPEHLQKLYSQGARLMVQGGEFMALSNMLENSARVLDQLTVGES